MNQVSPRDVLPVLDGILLPAIVEALRDHASVVKQEAAVKTLGQVGHSVTMEHVVYRRTICSTLVAWANGFLLR